MSRDPRSTWILVPARGGSKGIPRKNLRLLAGRPLVQHVLRTARGVVGGDCLLLSTDDPEIAAASDGLATIHERCDELASDRATLDEVAASVARWLLDRGANSEDFLLTLQPTSPLLTSGTIRRCMDELNDGARSVLTVRDDRHLRWRIDDDGRPTPIFDKRVNRQWLPATYVETGGVIGTRLGDLLEEGTRILEPVELVKVEGEEAIDVDSFADWAVAEYFLTRKSVVIRADASRPLGMGHVNRALALAHEFADQHLLLATRADGEYELGWEYLSGRGYSVAELESEKAFFQLLGESRPDMVVLDVLDTQRDFVERVREAADFVVSFEDLGPGSHLADLVINDLYTDLYPKENHWYGLQVSILGPQFEQIEPRDGVSPDVERVLVTFGGTDPNNLTLKALKALAIAEFDHGVTVVLGPGYAHPLPDLEDFGLSGSVVRSVENMAELMSSADLAITSAGRTVTELMVTGVPTIALCQNERELRHSHASSPYGVINLGLGAQIDPEHLSRHISLLTGDDDLRRDMQRRALQAVRERSNREIAGRILDELERKLRDDPTTRAAGEHP